MMTFQAQGVDMRENLSSSIKEQAWAVVEALISFSKPIIAGVNGPAVGFAVTSLSLCDIVYCSDTATFTTPFMKLGFCAEGCASITFPAIMGSSKANEMLLLGKTFSAQEMERNGFVSSVFPTDTFQADVLKQAELLASYPPDALKQTKALTRDAMKETLLEANRRELTLLVDRFLSTESINAVMKFMQEQTKKRGAKL
jgi:peroxisomal 3,2-trans-enoyl-CoA isomerase